MKIVSVGTVAFDAIETPFGKTDKIVGGACTYISLSASYFNSSANLISVVGEDFPEKTIELFKSRGINTEGLEIKKGEKTFFWSGKYHQDMNTRDTLDTQLNVLENFDPIVPENYQDCDILMLGNLTPSVQDNVIGQIKKRPKLIVLDTMNFWMEIAMDDLKKVIKKIDVLTINDEEARLLSVFSSSPTF
jgi:sugar/nucleoside kinase (ribokinase family)